MTAISLQKPASLCVEQLSLQRGSHYVELSAGVPPSERIAAIAYVRSGEEVAQVSLRLPNGDLTHNPGFLQDWKRSGLGPECVKPEAGLRFLETIAREIKGAYMRAGEVKTVS